MITSFPHFGFYWFYDNRTKNRSSFLLLIIIFSCSIFLYKERVKLFLEKYLSISVGKKMNE